MKFIRDNIAILLVAFMVLCLLFFTIRLQALILTDSTRVATGSPSSGLLTTLRRQLAAAISPPTEPSVLAQAIPLAPARPAVQVIPIASANTPMPTALPATPTLTPLPTIAPPTATLSAVPVATATSPPPTLPPATIPPTATTPPTPAADFQLGYIDRSDNCPLISEIMQQLMVKTFGYRVALVPFHDPAALFAGVAATDPQARIDWTLCYTDPDDRPFLEKHSGFLVVVGSAYRRANDKGYLIMSNGPVKKIIQQEQPCVGEFLKQFKIEEADLAGQTATTWVEQHRDLVQSWTTCQERR